MSGYGKPDEEQENAQAIVDNGVGLIRLMIPTGPSAKYCRDCHNPIPELRRQAQPGCQYCINCQINHDRLPNLKVVTKML